MKERSKSAAPSGEQSMDELSKRFQKLHTRKIQAETNLENATQQLARLKTEAQEKYGTDDVVELRKQLDRMKAENEEKRRSYQADLDRIENDLEQVEQKFATVDRSSGENGAK